MSQTCKMKDTVWKGGGHLYTPVFTTRQFYTRKRKAAKCSQQPLTACSGNSLRLPSANKSAALLFDACRSFPPAVGKKMVDSRKKFSSTFSKESRQEVVIRSRVGYEQLHALRSHDPLPPSLMCLLKQLNFRCSGETDKSSLISPQALNWPQKWKHHWLKKRKQHLIWRL